MVMDNWLGQKSSVGIVLAGPQHNQVTGVKYWKRLYLKRSIVLLLVFYEKVVMLFFSLLTLDLQ
jgi:hypothetical protein